MARTLTTWNAFLPIGSSLKSDDLPEADVTALQVRGIELDALRVLRCIRQDVLPLVRDLQKKGLLKSFSFLVHDRTSGVPTSPEDREAYIHLRLVFLTSVFRTISGRVRKTSPRELLPEKWILLQRVDVSPAEAKAHQVIDPQSAWYLDLVESLGPRSDFEALLQVRQHLHYFANMAQMRIS